VASTKKKTKEKTKKNVELTKKNNEGFGGKHSKIQRVREKIIRDVKSSSKSLLGQNEFGFLAFGNM